MTKSHACPECGGSLPPNTPQGLCPRCLLGAAISDTISYAPGGSTPTGNPQTPAWPMDLETFRIAVVELGLMGAEELASYAAAASVDVSGLARALVRARKLTPYQAGALTQGKGRGLLIGNYLVLEKRGQGGMGIVFKARDRRTGRLVALKILPPSFGRDPEAVQRFRREFKLASRLNHPNIVAALDADEDRGVQFLTMDYIEGHDLDDLVSEVGPLPIKLATHCLIQAASGLEAAHAQGIVHRDIKPSNLMLDSSGAVRVLDLGLARVMEAASPIGQSVDGSGGLTLSGAYMGTVDFVAPEQADNSKKANHLADIYSLGCTIHFLLTGRSPFDGDTMLKRLMAHQTRPAPSLRAARPDVPAALEDAYQAMMAKRPTDRPPSMTRVIAMLEACQASANESKEARATLKTFAGTVMQQASPKRQAWDVESANFTRPTLRDHPRLDPHLNLADLGIDFRDDEEENAGPAYEEVGPPKFRRLGAIGERFRRQPAELVLWAFALLGFCVAASMLVPRRRLEPPTVRQAEPKPWAVAQAKPEPWAAQPKFEEAIETESAPNSEPKVSVPPQDATTSSVPAREAKNKVETQERPTTPPIEPTVLETPAPGTILFSDDFSDPASGWPQMSVEELAKKQATTYGYENGVWYSQSRGVAQYVGKPLAPPLPEFEAEIQVRVVGKATLNRGSAVIHFFAEEPGQTIENSRRSFQVRIDGQGKLYLEARESKDKLEAVVPWMGPVTHPAIKKGGELNSIKFRVFKHQLEIFVNSESVCEPVEFDWSLIPMRLGFGSESQAGVVRVEWDRVEFRKLDPSTAPALRLGPVFYSDDFNDPTSGWSLDSTGMCKREYDNGLFSFLAQRGWDGSFTAERASKLLPHNFQVEVVGRILAEAPIVKGAWGVIIGREDGRGVDIKIDRNAVLTLVPSFWGAEKFPNDQRVGPIVHPAIRPADQFNKLTVRVKNREVQIYVNSVRVCEPISIDWDLLPAAAHFNLQKPDSDTRLRVDYDRIELRELAP